MNFTFLQWCAAVALVVAVAFGVVFVRGFFVISVVIQLVQSAIYLPILIAASAYMRTFPVSELKAATVAIISASVLFALIFIFGTTFFALIGKVTMCTGNQCTWINGTITWFGILRIAGETAIQLVANAVPYLAVFAFSRRNSPQLGLGADRP